MTARLSTAAADFLRIFCAALLLSLGLGHQPVSAAPPESYSEEYRLPDGTFAEICTEGGHQPEPAVKPLCEVCLLASSLILPPPDDAVWLISARHWLANRLPHLSDLPGGNATGRPNSRGPPVLI